MTLYHPNCFLNLSRLAIRVRCQILSSMEFLDNIRPSFLLNAHPLTKTMFGFFKSELFDFELTFILGTATTGGCDIAEFFEALGKIKNHNPESWYGALYEQGERAESIAAEAGSNEYSALARKVYFRASKYFRAAPYMLGNPDERILKCVRRGRSGILRVRFLLWRGRSFFLRFRTKAVLACQDIYIYLRKRNACQERSRCC